MNTYSELEDIIKSKDAYVHPLFFKFLFNNEVARKLVESIHWKNGRSCARCGSKYTKELNSSVFLEMYRCIDCGYMFNALSGTVFQGTKLPLTKFLHLFIIMDAMGDELNPKDVVYALDVTYKTAMALKMKAKRIPCHVAYISRDRQMTDALRSATRLPHVDPDHERFVNYCDANGILINPDGFARRIAEISAWSHKDEA